MIDKIDDALAAYVKACIEFEIMQTNGFPESTEDSYFYSHDYYADEMNDTKEKLNREIEEYAMLSYSRGLKDSTAINTLSQLPFGAPGQVLKLIDGIYTWVDSKSVGLILPDQLQE